MNIGLLLHVELHGSCSQCQRQTPTCSQRGQAVALPQESCTIYFGKERCNDLTAFSHTSFSTGHKLTESSKNMKKPQLARFVLLII